MSVLAMTILDDQICHVMFTGKNNGVLPFELKRAFSKRPPVLNIPSEMKGFKLRIGLDRGTHFLWFPDAP